MKINFNKPSKIAIGLAFNYLTLVTFTLVFLNSVCIETTVAQAKSGRRNIKRKQKATKVLTQIYQTIDDNLIYISDEGDFEVKFPNTTPANNINQQLKRKSSVLQSQLGALPATMISLDAGEYFYAVIQYDLPNKIEDLESTQQLVERAGFLKLKPSEEKIFDTSNTQLGTWLERSFDCATLPGDSLMCVKERFFVYKSKLYRLSSMLNSSKPAMSKEAEEKKMNAFLETFKLRQEN